MNRRLLLALCFTILAANASAKTVNENVDELPPGCDAIAGETAIEVRGGREHAAGFPGAVFSFDVRSFELPACTRVTMTFHNDDDIRHQFMVHDAYPRGFFLLEADGDASAEGRFITGSLPKTMLTHCGIPSHQQMGMKAQVLVAGGEGDLPNILGVSGIPAADGGTGPGPTTPPSTPSTTTAAPDATPLGAAVAVLALLMAVALAGHRAR